jgi:hypothetical protein
LERIAEVVGRKAEAESLEVVQRHQREEEYYHLMLVLLTFWSSQVPKAYHWYISSACQLANTCVLVEYQTVETVDTE